MQSVRMRPAARRLPSVAHLFLDSPSEFWEGPSPGPDTSVLVTSTALRRVGYVAIGWRRCVNQDRDRCHPLRRPQSAQKSKERRMKRYLILAASLFVGLTTIGVKRLSAQSSQSHRFHRKQR